MLQDFVRAHHSEIIARCRQRVAKGISPTANPPEIDHGVPAFLDELIGELRSGTTRLDEQISRTAAEHGHDLLLQGFTPSQVVHHYGDICQVIMEMVIERNAPISTEDFRTLNQCLDDAIAAAITRYGQDRETFSPGTSKVESDRLPTLVDGPGAAILTARALEQAILEGTHFSCIATDACGVIKIFNAGAERLLGYTAAEVLNTIPPTQLHDPLELIARAEALSVEFGRTIAPGFEALVFKAARGIEDTYELTKVRKDGSRFRAVVSVTALRDPADAIIGYLLIGSDDSARYQIEEERLKLVQRLQRKNSELKSEFLANMSHELRTPLNAIIGFSETLRDGLMGAVTDQQRRFMSNILDSGKHLLALINDMLDLSQVEAGTMTLNLESLSIAALLRNSFSIVQDEGARDGIRLKLEIAEDLGPMLADRHQITQIVHNLLTNAVKFTAGGQVTLRVARVGRAKVGQLSDVSRGLSFPVPETEFANYLEICVIDSGIGISPENLKDLFQPFSQVDTGLARHFEGSGLGLVMVKRLAELHGGTVAVESEVGEGSRFTVWIPLRAVQHESAPRG